MAQSGIPGSYGPATGLGRLPRRFWIIAAIIILLLILLLLLFFFPRPRATVTLTPKHQTLSTTIPSRTLYASPQDLGPGDSTGSKQIPPASSKGDLTFQNYTSEPVTVPAHTQMKDNANQVFETDEPITIPRDPPIIPGVGHVSAHAVKTGKSGNIEAMGINTTYQSPDIKVFNMSPFSGGSDGQTVPIVQQSDVDKVAKPLQTSLIQKAQSDIQSQLKQGEKLVNPTPQCSTNVTSNPGVGESAAKFTVTVSVACSDAAYNAQQAEDQLKQIATQQLGPGYVQDGPITVKTEQGQNGNATASQPWKYQFTSAQKSDFAKYIARKTKGDATTWLKQQKGVQDASITVTGPIIDLSGGNTVPDDLGAITING